MLGTPLVLLLLIVAYVPRNSYSMTFLNHMGSAYNEIKHGRADSEQDDSEIGDDLLDQDIEAMMSNNLNDEYDHGCPGLGYDSIYANSLGSDSSPLDPGYRAPIIEFTWRKNSEGYSPTLNSLHPVGGWVRPVFSCSRSTKINEISNIDEFKNSLSASTKLNGDIPLNSFTGSLEYKNTFSSFKSKKQKIYSKTEQCIRYQVGIPLNLKWKHTEPFDYMATRLPVIDSKHVKHCNIRDKKNFAGEKCASIKLWIKFFDMFGTHFTNQLTLGGKITQTMRFDLSSLKELEKKGIDIDFEIRTELGSGGGNLGMNMKKKKTNLEDLGYKKMSVLGGQMPNFPLNDDVFSQWGRSVADNPMPIGVVATSLKVLLDPSLHSSYDEALHQFAILNGITYEQLKTISGNLTEISKEIEKSVTLVSWNRENRIKCPKGSNVLFGLSLIFGDKKLLGVNYCNSNK